MQDWINVIKQAAIEECVCNAVTMQPTVVNNPMLHTPGDVPTPPNKTINYLLLALAAYTTYKLLS